jgi:hypothetical protein
VVKKSSPVLGTKVSHLATICPKLGKLLAWLSRWCEPELAHHIPSASSSHLIRSGACVATGGPTVPASIRDLVGFWRECFISV